MGTRRTPGHAIAPALRDARSSMTLADLSFMEIEEEAAPRHLGVFEDEMVWTDELDDVDADENGDLDPFIASLRKPLIADDLDLSGSLRAVGIEVCTPCHDAAGSVSVAPRAKPAHRGRGGAAHLRPHRVRSEQRCHAVCIPGAGAQPTEHATPASPRNGPSSERLGGTALRWSAGRRGAGRRAKQPPLWLLANIAILLVAGLAVLPRVASADAAAGCLWHTVRPGDTLGDLGWTYHSSALKLAAANHITNPNLIYVGQKLCIPVVTNASAPSAPKTPAKSSPPNFGTASGVKSFIAFVLPYAHSAHQQTGWPTSLILAQWGLEQGWHTPSYTGYNFGNCGAIPGEPTIGGLNVPGSPAAFSYARTPADGLRQYVHVAHLGYYTAVAPTAARSGVDAAARALGRSPWDAGHYTATGNPGSSLLAILHTFDLYWYDSN